HLVALIRQLGRNPLPPLGVQVDQDGSGAGLGEARQDDPADAGGRPRDDADLPLELSRHPLPPLTRRRPRRPSHPTRGRPPPLTRVPDPRRGGSPLARGKEGTPAIVYDSASVSCRSPSLGSARPDPCRLNPWYILPAPSAAGWHPPASVLK